MTTRRTIMTFSTRGLTIVCLTFCVFFCFFENKNFEEISEIRTQKIENNRNFRLELDQKYVTIFKKNAITINIDSIFANNNNNKTKQNNMNFQYICRWTFNWTWSSINIRMDRSMGCITKYT